MMPTWLEVNFSVRSLFWGLHLFPPMFSHMTTAFHSSAVTRRPAQTLYQTIFKARLRKKKKSSHPNAARHLLYFLCVPIKPNVRRFAPLGARPSGLSGLDRTTSSSLSPDNAPFPLQSPRRPPPSDAASPSQAGGTPDQCPVAPHVSAAEPLSVHPSGQANTHTAPNAGAPLQLTLASLGTSRPGHCTSASERHTDRS